MVYKLSYTPLDPGSIADPHTLISRKQHIRSVTPNKPTPEHLGYSDALEIALSVLSGN